MLFRSSNADVLLRHFLISRFSADSHSLFDDESVKQESGDTIHDTSSRATRSSQRASTRGATISSRAYHSRSPEPTPHSRTTSSGYGSALSLELSEHPVEYPEATNWEPEALIEEPNRTLLRPISLVGNSRRTREENVGTEHCSSRLSRWSRSRGSLTASISSTADSLNTMTRTLPPPYDEYD